MSKPALTAQQWDEARRLRAAGVSFARIAKQAGTTTSTVARHAKREGWTTPGRAPRPKPQPAETADVRRGLVHRLYALMDLSLEMTELRMQKQLKEARRIARSKDFVLPAAPREVDMDHIATAMKNFEQAKELDTDLHRPADGGAQPGGVPRDAPASEADAFRRDIAERLGKLVPPS